MEADNKVFMGFLIGLVAGAILMLFILKLGNEEAPDPNVVPQLPDCICNVRECPVLEEVNCVSEIVNEITKVESDKRILKEAIK